MNPTSSANSNIRVCCFFTLGRLSPWKGEQYWHGMANYQNDLGDGRGSKLLCAVVVSLSVLGLFLITASRHARRQGWSWGVDRSFVNVYMPIGSKNHALGWAVADNEYVFHMIPSIISLSLFACPSYMFPPF